ncbi:MAG: cysteine--tRNA ligase [Patescibacteria group bacterium]
MKLYNTLSRKIEEFVPINPGKVGVYSCGPTVYDYPHIGNWRTFIFDDILRRVLEYNGLAVIQVMNATDVGHLTGDNVGDADLGEDRMVKAAKRENKTAWEIADFYIKDFIESLGKLNIEKPNVFARATDHIKEQIELIKQLEANGLVYVTPMGIYFEASKFSGYGKLGGQKMIDKRVATRDELKEDSDKKNPFDFALWKFSKPEDKRQMEWGSPWGKGFPGWHLECSAMAIKYLGESFDIHTGGVDHIAIHHTNEIAQSEGATGKTFAKYWMHGEFLTVDGGRMGKSLGNAFTLQDVINKGFDPLALRYFYFSAHYRQKQNFTWEALENARNGLNKLRNKAQSLASQEVLLRGRFLEAINNDLNMPEALAVAWQTENRDDLVEFDKVFGLDLFKTEEKIIPEEIKKLIAEREVARKNKDYKKADEFRDMIKSKGYDVNDTKISSNN